MRGLMNKRIVIFVGTLAQGGAERVISILSRYIYEAGYKIEILLYHDEEIFYEIPLQIKVISVKRESETKNVLKNVFWIRRYFEDNSDIIISFLAPFNIIALISHMGLKSTIVVADRNDPRFVPSNRVVRLLRDALYRFADGVVLQTSQNQAYFSRQIQKKSTVIFNPVDLGEKACLALRKSKQKKIVTVGRLMPQKNQKMLLDAFAEVSKDYPEHKLWIYGEGPERDNLRKYADKLGIGAKVQLPGSVKDVFDLISDAELFVLCSNFEGMPNALIEAMCVGLPCITTRVSGVEDLVINGKNGEIINVGDVVALIEKMRMLLEDEKKRTRYARNAIKLNRRLAADRIMNKWMGYINLHIDL